ncbi:MAG TPA: protein kinase [Gemmatimonadaceae bacterium]|nr:protein kinase [Gemmatimonadaceae bacterium]
MTERGLTTSDFELRAQVDRALSANYELAEEIGRGGMGIVYRARDKRLKRTVAVKLLPPELAFRSDIRTRFLREAETSAQLSHPNIVPIYTVGEEGNLVYFIMAYIGGDNLAKLIHDRGPLDPTEVRRILREVADALSYAHGRKVVHRDIKPDNILLDSDTGRAMVTDFGIARAVIEGSGSKLTATGMALGTPAYMSPEQAAGDSSIDGRTDLYSLGVVAYQMLSGELPFDAPNTPAMLVKHLSELPRPISDRTRGVPPDLARAVMLMLEKSPDARFPSAGALAVALESGNVPEPQRTQWSPTTPQPLVTRYEPRPLPTTEIDDDMERWEARPVRKFRKSLAPFIAVNAVIFVASIVTGVDLFVVTVFWSIGMAIQYSKLWSAGYDWRDVFRQPRDRLFVDVAGETLDDARAIFDPSKREEVRAKMRARRSTPQRSLAAARPGTVAEPRPRDSGRNRGGRSERADRGGRERGPSDGARDRETPIVARARSDRDEIRRLVDSLPDEDSQMIPDVVPSADQLFDKIKSLSNALAAVDSHGVEASAIEVEQEIELLEAQANPLEAGSEQRVRRLAGLKRRRRALMDVKKRRDEATAKIESCGIALENMRLDVLRLRTGGQTHYNVTLLAEQAMRLARDVDVLAYAADETGRVSATR